MKTAGILLPLLFCLPWGGLSAQAGVTPAAAIKRDSPLEAAWKKVTDQGKVPPLTRADRRDIEKVRAWRAKRKAAAEKVKKAAARFLKEYAPKLESGEGLFYKASALNLLGERDKALDLFLAFRKASPKSPKALEAGINALFILYVQNKYDQAKKLLKELNNENVDRKYSKILDTLGSRLKGRNYKMWKVREALKGKPLPEIPVVDVIGDKNFDWKKFKGKVLVLDFWATWCGPCRMVIPSLVKLQKEFKDKGLQVVGVTTYYGFAWELTGREGDTLIGKSAGRVSRERELELNRIFHDKVPLDYPIVITERKVGSKTFGIVGIPTLFVVDRKGIVRYYKVGSGNEEALRKVVVKLLEEK